jgi:hypothetical protein
MINNIYFFSSTIPAPESSTSFFISTLNELISLFDKDNTEFKGSSI